MITLCKVSKMMKNYSEAGKCGEFLRNVLMLDPSTLKAQLTTLQKLGYFEELRQKSQ